MHAGDDELVSMGRGLAEAALQQLVPGVAVHAGRNSVNLLQLERGHANVAEGQPVGEDTIFRIFSLTKVIVSAAALPLLDSGALTLDEPVSKWLPEFETMQVWKADTETTVTATSPIRVRDVLRHTAGMYYPDRPNGTPGVGSAPLTRLFDSSGVREASSLAEAWWVAPCPICARLCTVRARPHLHSPSRAPTARSTTAVAASALPRSRWCESLARASATG